MAGSNHHVTSWKCFLKLYNSFKNWTFSQESMAKTFKLINTSFDELSMDSSSETPNILPEHLIIMGVIYPSSELFGTQGLKIKILVPPSYPHQPPIVYLCTCIRHPNIERDGKLCSSKLIQNSTYKAVMWNALVEIVIKILENPELDTVVDAEAASLYKTNNITYNREIKEAATKYKDRADKVEK